MCISQHSRRATSSFLAQALVLASSVYNHSLKRQNTAMLYLGECIKLSLTRGINKWSQSQTIIHYWLLMLTFLVNIHYLMKKTYVGVTNSSNVYQYSIHHFCFFFIWFQRLSHLIPMLKPQFWLHGTQSTYVEILLPFIVRNLPGLSKMPILFLCA